MAVVGRVRDVAGGGVAGVLVSDGLEVVITDGEGRYELAGSGPFVILTRPSGWTCDRWFTPTEATAGGEVVADFVLTPTEQTLPVRFVQVTDLHVSLGSPDYAPSGGDDTIWFDETGLHERIVTTPAVLDELWRDIAAHAPDAAFVVATGDLTNTGIDAEYEAYVASVATSAIPVVSIPGNHDHHAHGDELPDGVAADFHAEPTRYERHLGPRWFSFDHAGLHVVAIDWFTHLLGVDRDRQEAWLQADLAAIPADQPVVLLAHDQMPTDFFARLPRQPVAAFSGHWHTSRVVRLNGTLHVNTPTATFGGLDFSPAALRVATWDGNALTLETVARTPAPHAPAAHTAAAYRAAPSTAATQVTSLPGATQRGGPIVAGDLVLATSRDEDAARGWLTAVDRGSGSVAWEIEASAPIKSSPLVVGDAVVIADVSGETRCVGLDGTLRWVRQVDDPLRLWTYLKPATDGTRVFVGDVARFVALDVATGEEVWARTDLGQRENMTSWGDPLVVDGTLLVAFSAQAPVLYGLDPATGATRWPAGATGRSIYRGPAEEVAIHLPRTIVAPPAADPDGEDAYVVRLGSMIERLRAADGEAVWVAPHHGWFNPGQPVVLGELVVAATGMGRVRAYDRAAGDLRWEVSVGAPAPVAAGAYRGDGPLAVSGLAAVDGDTVVTALGDGTMVAIDGAGRVGGSVDLGAPALASLDADDEAVWTTTTDGALHRVPLDRLML